MKNYLILSGGAFRGSFQLGAIEVLKEQGIKFDKVFGVSTGAMNGVMVAQDKVEDLNKLWWEIADKGQLEIFEPIVATFENDKMKLSTKAVKKILLKGGLWSLIKGDFTNNIIDNVKEVSGLFNMNPLRDKLRANVSIDDFKSDFHFGIVDYNTAQYSSLSNKDFYNTEQLIDGVVSSGSMPVIAEPVSLVRTYKKSHFNALDGGVRNSSPIGDAIDEFNKEEGDVHFYIINCNTGYNKVDTGDKNVINIAMRTIEIMMSQMFLQDLKMFKIINDLADGVRYKKMPYTLITATDDILGDAMLTSLIPFRYALGARIAKEVLKKK